MALLPQRCLVLSSSSVLCLLGSLGVLADPNATTGATAEGMPPPLSPLRGIAYGSLPCTARACEETGWVSEDMLQDAYAKQWGSEGRDDLGTMARLGANAVRLYHSLGLGVDESHGGFLDRAQEVGLNVLAGYHTYASCPEYNCFETWKRATLQGFATGFQRGQSWHPAVAALILLNEPDLVHPGSGAEGRIRLVLSAMDGVLAAEREAGVTAGRVRLTVTWSFAMQVALDGTLQSAAGFGFQDTASGVMDPALVGYVPESSLADLQHAFRTRWIHGLNTQAPWNYVKAMMAPEEPKFSGIPWFIGEYGANGQSAATIQADLEAIQKMAEADELFLGAAFFQFQTAHFKGGSELNFGLFRLGNEKLFDITASCMQDHARVWGCKDTWPVYCLSPDLDWLPGTMGNRAAAVAAAWQGSLEGDKGLCKGGARRLDEGASRDGRVEGVPFSQPVLV